MKEADSLRSYLFFEFIFTLQRSRCRTIKRAYSYNPGFVDPQINVPVLCVNATLFKGSREDSNLAHQILKRMFYLLQNTYNIVRNWKKDEIRNLNILRYLKNISDWNFSIQKIYLCSGKQQQKTSCQGIFSIFWDVSCDCWFQNWCYLNPVGYRFSNNLHFNAVY